MKKLLAMATKLGVAPIEVTFSETTVSGGTPDENGLISPIE